jgi:hypothetical protein
MFAKHGLEIVGGNGTTLPWSLGGDPKNRHASERRGDGRKRHALNKAPVVALVCRETGEVRAKVIPSVTGDSLYSAIKGNVATHRSHLQTDEHRGYTIVSYLLGKHTTVNHSKGEYVARNGATTNPAESFFAGSSEMSGVGRSRWLASCVMSV